MARLFVAIWPPDHVLDTLGDIAQPRDQGVRWIEREQRHLTLCFIGEADPAAVADALARVDFGSVVATLGPAFDVLGEHSLVVPVAGVDGLASAASDATRGLGSFRTSRRFVGHITVAKLRRNARPTRSIGRRVDAMFDVDEIALVESTLRPTGAEYETIATWPAR